MSRFLTMNKLGIGGIVMMLVVMLAALGLGIALWSKILTIDGIIATGNVNAEFVRVFTDDDDFIDNPAKDAYDDPRISSPPPPLNPGLPGAPCEVHVGPDDSPLGNNKDPDDGFTSCDPAETGRDPKLRYNKDVARCDALFIENDDEPQPGSQRARVAITNGYPSYHCTAWFDIHNNGTIPILLHGVKVMGVPGLPCELGSRPYDLDGDGKPDIEICVSELPEGEPQIDPSQVFQFNLDIHVMQTAPQDALLAFDANVCLHQWNEETGACPEAGVACNGAVADRCIDGDGIATAGRGAFAIAVGDALTGWPTGGDPDNHGIDTFDQDVSSTWSDGDDIHLEGASAACPTGVRNGAHELGADCIVLDLNGDLAAGQLVDCDLEFYIDFTPGPPGCDPLLKFRDSNGDGFYDNAEDIILDVNGNGVFD